MKVVVNPKNTLTARVQGKSSVLVDQSGQVIRRLGDLTDVDLSDLQDGSLLIYSAAPTTTGVPSRLSFFTSDTTGTLAERMRITSGAEVWIAGTTDRGAYNLQCNGTGVWGAGAYVNGSDARIKDNIEPIGSCKDVVNALNPITFRYKPDFSNDQSLQPGFIAQELQEALSDQPYLEGVVQGGPEYLNVAYQTLIPVLTKALQETMQEIADLKARLDAANL